MNGKTPHIVQYQGSKRLLAPQILQYMPQRFNRLLEPFAGMAAISIAAAREKRTSNYVINDINEPIVRLLQASVDTPKELITNYTRLWNEQFDFDEGHVNHFYHVRERLNSGEQTAENMLYLLARCVKGAVRYGGNGNFNQSPDNRRHGANPKTIARNIYAVSYLLKGKAEFSSLDYHDVFMMEESGDLVYLDPPYQGVTNSRDNRYLSGVGFSDFADSIQILNDKGVDFIISYDGISGGKKYGADLPEYLRLTKILLNAGRSTQATLLGKREVTFEALYLSEGLRSQITSQLQQTSLFEIEDVG
jgi:DNA adenine methylase